VIFAGHEITGGVLSVTVTVWVAVAVLPCASVAVQVTVVVPTGKVFPDGLRETVTPGQLSLADAVPRVASLTTVSHVVAPGPVLAVTFGGAVIVGFSVSLTVIVCVHDELLFDPSVAVQVMVVVPLG
jgi:hypothetical protein